MNMPYLSQVHSRLSKLALPVLVAVLSAAHANAQDAYPTKPVRFIAPFPPGGTTDVLCRVLAQKLGDNLGRQFIVENRPGASGNIGIEVAAKAPPDGYTLVLISSSALTINPHTYKRMGFDPLTDFSPISMVATGGQVFVVHPSVPAHNVKELIALARARPGKLTYGSGGKGTPAHFSGEVLKAAAGIHIVHVPYKGTIQSVTDLVAGQIDMVLSDMVPAVPQINAGRLRALAVSSEQRSQALPSVPTLAELGVSISIPQTWWAVFMPKGSPAAIVNRLNGELAKIMKMRDVQERYASLGIFTVHSTPEKVLEQVRIETPAAGKVLKAAGVEPE
jgi:tripartite-type tricarboxylate transporter receptor subunit TctC